MTTVRPTYLGVLAVVVATVSALGALAACASHTNDERTQARAAAVEAMHALTLPAGISQAPRTTSCGVPAEEGVCLLSTLTPEATSSALSAVIAATSPPVKGPDLGKAPAGYTVTGTVAGEPVLASTSANLIGPDKTKYQLVFKGSTVALGLVPTE